MVKEEYNVVKDGMVEKNWFPFQQLVMNLFLGEEELVSFMVQDLIQIVPDIQRKNVLMLE